MQALPFFAAAGQKNRSINRMQAEYASFVDKSSL